MGESVSLPPASNPDPPAPQHPGSRSNRGNDGNEHLTPLGVLCHPSTWARAVHPPGRAPLPNRASAARTA